MKAKNGDKIVLLKDQGKIKKGTVLIAFGDYRDYLRAHLVSNSDCSGIRNRDYCLLTEKEYELYTESISDEKEVPVNNKEFKKGDYVVLLKSCNGQDCWGDSIPEGFCYKLKEDFTRFRFNIERDIKDSVRNGWSTPDSQYDSKLEVRRATEQEKLYYEKYNKPFNTMDLYIPTFEVGKWYEFKANNLLNIGKVKGLDKHGYLRCEPWILNNSYYVSGTWNTHELVRELKVEDECIQKYLPDNHPDKIVQKELTGLPEKWYCLYENKDQFDVMNAYFKNKWNYVKGVLVNGCTNLDNQNNWWGTYCNDKTAIQITFEQFKRWVVDANRDDTTLKYGSAGTISSNRQGNFPDPLSYEVIRYVKLIKNWSIREEYIGEVFELSTLDNLSKFKYAPGKSTFKNEIKAWIKDGHFREATKEEFEKQERQRDLISEVKKRYPVGTNIYQLYSGGDSNTSSVVYITNHDHFSLDSDNEVLYFSQWRMCTKNGGIWAEIVKEETTNTKWIPKPGDKVYGKCRSGFDITKVESNEGEEYYGKYFIIDKIKFSKDEYDTRLWSKGTFWSCNLKAIYPYVINNESIMVNEIPLSDGNNLYYVTDLYTPKKSNKISNDVVKTESIKTQLKQKSKTIKF